MNVKTIAAMVAVIVIISSLWIFRDIVAPIFQVVLFSIAIIAILLALGVFIFLAHLTIEKMRMTSLDRKTKEHAEHAEKYRYYQDGFGMGHLLNTSTDRIENLSTFPGSHHNGRWEEPHPAAAAAWEKLVGKRSGESPVTYLLPPEQKPQLDLMAIMTQAGQCYAIIGGQQRGKTFQARKIASYWLGQNLKPLVIGPKWDRGEWDGCLKAGGEYDFNRVMVGLDTIKKLGKQRHADTSRGHKDHQIQPVFVDDWTTIRAKLENEAEGFIIDATTLYASVNIILYFIIHLDTANAWGVGKVGAALHQNFVKLFIEPGFNEAGVIDHSKNIGWLLMPGQSKKDRQQVPLFTQTGRQVVTVEPDLVIPPTRITEREQRIMALHQAGWEDGAIADKVYAGHGGNQVRRVREVIDKLALHIKP